MHDAAVGKLHLEQVRRHRGEAHAFGRHAHRRPQRHAGTQGGLSEGGQLCAGQQGWHWTKLRGHERLQLLRLVWLKGESAAVLMPGRIGGLQVMKEHV